MTEGLAESTGMMPADVLTVPRSHASSGKSANANIDIDTHYEVRKDVYVPGEFRRPHMNINAVSVEPHGDDFIRPNAHLGTRIKIRSKEQLKHMYLECSDGM